jgi:hypothetical protein
MRPDTYEALRKARHYLCQAKKWKELYEECSVPCAPTVITLNTEEILSVAACSAQINLGLVDLSSTPLEFTIDGNDIVVNCGSSEPVDIYFNDNPFAQVDCGEDFFFYIVDQDDNPVVPISIDGNTIQVDTQDCGTVQINVNGNAFYEADCGETVPISIVDSDEDPVTILSITGTQITVQTPCPPLTYFEMVVKTDNTGISASNQFLLQFNGLVGVQIDWGDGSTQQYVFNAVGSNSVTKTYATAGTYTIRLYGWWVRILLFQNDANKVLSVNNWGVNVWGSMLNSFRDTLNLTLNATDAPNLGALTTMAGLFRVSSINANIGHWILPATLTTMDGIFQSSAMNAANYTDTLVAWMLQSGAPNNVNAGNQTGRTFDSSRPAPAPYMNAGSVRTFATTPVIDGGKGWTISGDTVI